MTNQIFRSKELVISLRIRIRLFALFREMAGGKKELEIEINKDPATIMDVIEALGEKINKELSQMILEKWQKFSSLIILLNGRNIRMLKGLETNVNDGDEIAIFPPGAGGI